MSKTTIFRVCSTNLAHENTQMLDVATIDNDLHPMSVIVETHCEDCIRVAIEAEVNKPMGKGVAARIVTMKTPPVEVTVEELMKDAK